ncbi:MAG: DUF1990 domain-containing protein [Actinomycetia bacterium]|nr:DUF1990 domain-containing protein [Actinomycetes bacterium]
MSEITYPLRLRGLSLPLARGARYVPGPWHVLVESQVIGAGENHFRRAARRISSWEMHRDSGMQVEARAGATVGSQVTMRIGTGWCGLTAQCEVIATVDTDREAGFAYGTLARHPERGEEAFIVRWLEDDSVVGTVAAFSRPAQWYTKAGGPVTRAVQTVAARRYLAAMLKS